MMTALAKGERGSRCSCGGPGAGEPVLASPRSVEALRWSWSPQTRAGGTPEAAASRVHFERHCCGTVAALPDLIALIVGSFCCGDPSAAATPGSAEPRPLGGLTRAQTLSGFYLGDKRGHAPTGHLCCIKVQ